MLATRATRLEFAHFAASRLLKNGWEQHPWARLIRGWLAPRKFDSNFRPQRFFRCSSGPTQSAPKHIATDGLRGIHSSVPGPEELSPS
jgi:hypothetical protein